MRFTKMHGISNDYVYIDLFEETVDDPAALSIEVSDRRRGVGSDGLILIGPSDTADFSMRIFNADGSEAEMCGNGIRCVGKYVYDHALTRKTTVSVETLGGPKMLDLVVVGGKVAQVRVDMGEPGLKPSDVPMLADDDSVPAVAVPVAVGQTALSVTAISMGNPHCVTFVPDTDSAPVHTLGPRVERHASFPRRTNVEFVQVLNRAEVRMRVWERGSGETWACGTGACAVAVASCLNGLTERSVLVHLLGGDLNIEWASDNHVHMTGPATEVFTGTLTPGGLS